MATKKKTATRGKAQPVKIPLAFEDAVKALLATPPPPKKSTGARKRPPKSKRG